MQINIESESSQPPKHGLILLQVLMALLFVVMVFRLWHLQILQGEHNAQRANANRWREQQIYANRGLVLDARGVILAANRPSYAVALTSEDCPDIPSTLAKVSQWTGEPMSKLERLYRQSREEGLPKFSPLILAHDIKFEQVARLESQVMNWPGLSIIAQQRRFYPQGDIFAHVLGYVALANAREVESYAGLYRGDSVGKQGIELKLENSLRGVKGRVVQEVDALGRPLARDSKAPPVGGRDVRLSLDADLQLFAMRAMAGNAGSIVVMDPDTGRILALTTSPSYDNNLFTGRLSAKDWGRLRDDERHPLQNRAIQSVYPPGSIWKLVMAAMFMREGIGRDETVTCTGEFRLGNRVFRCWRAGGHGRVNMLRSLVESCDVYYYQMADRLGIDKLTEFAAAAGFGRLTGIDLPSEKPGVVPGREWKRRMRGEAWQRGETINASIGQGYTLTTPVQMAVYVSSLLNGGRLLKPLLLEEENPVERGRVPSTEAERIFLLKAMREVVENRQGTARRLKMDDAVIGAKTGTAQVVALGDTRLRTEDMLYQHRDHAWVATWGMKGDKRYVVVVMLEHGGGGGASAAPVAAAVYAYLFKNKKPESVPWRNVAASGYITQSDPAEARGLDEIIRASKQWEPFVGPDHRSAESARRDKDDAGS
ncbi:MAG: penicillin-binding protein 2 [Deltaproteobacteria bacterium]|nr:penicillin-binding protein 2 [Deltaproteobacteria bacterium]